MPAPTLDEFRIRFPEFVDQSDELIEALIVEAQLTVDINTWYEPDYKPAVMYLTAHLLSMSIDQMGAGGGSVGDIASESFGPISISYVQRQSADGSFSVYSKTGYGQQFETIRRRNIGGPLVV
jgi:hypothetical protein